MTLELATPHGEPVRTVYAAAHVLSSSPPDPKVQYQIDYSTDGGKTWKPVVKDWTINRQGDEPKDFWSQSLCWGSIDLPAGEPRRRCGCGSATTAASGTPGPKCTSPTRRPGRTATKVTFAWTDDRGPHQESHTAAGQSRRTWTVPTGKNVVTRWVEFEPVK